MKETKVFIATCNWVNGEKTVEVYSHKSHAEYYAMVCNARLKAGKSTPRFEVTEHYLHTKKPIFEW